MPPKRQPIDPAECPHLARAVVRRFDPTTKEELGLATVCERCKTVLGWLRRE